MMAGDLVRVASKASTTNGSKETRGSRTLRLLCFGSDGARRRSQESVDAVPPPASARAALNAAPGRTHSAH